jgi:hypothetical protein
MPKSKWSALFSLILVFLSGVLVGTISHRVYMTNTAEAPEVRKGGRRPDPEQVRKQRITEMREALKLDDQQVQAIENVYDDTRAQFEQSNRSINEGQIRRIMDILRADQRPQYAELRKRWDMQRKRRMDMMKQQGFNK